MFMVFGHKSIADQEFVFCLEFILEFEFLFFIMLKCNILDDISSVSWVCMGNGPLLISDISGNNLKEVRLFTFQRVFQCSFWDPSVQNFQQTVKRCLIKTGLWSQVWWLMLLIIYALGRQRQVNLLSSRTAWCTEDSQDYIGKPCLGGGVGRQTDLCVVYVQVFKFQFSLRKNTNIQIVSGEGSTGR